MKHQLMITALFITSTALAGAPDDLPKLKIFHCPTAASITKDPAKQIWHSPDHNFQSYEFSFADKIAHFSGAEWSGATLGHVYCIYQPKQSSGSTLFPIGLLFKALVLQPQGWHSYKHGQLFVCKSNNPKNCPFTVNAKPPKIDPFQEALNLKGDANSDDQDS